MTFIHAQKRAARLAAPVWGFTMAKGITGLSALMLTASGIAMLAGSAGADSCTPAGTGGNDTITCQADANADNTVPLFDAGGGNDTITISSGTFGGTIAGEGDADTINMNGGSVAELQGDRGILPSGPLLISPVGADTITLSGGTVTGEVRGMQEGDTITLSGSNVLGNIYGDLGPEFAWAGQPDGADVINLTAGSVGGSVFGEGAADTITLSGTASVTGNIDGGTEGDTISVTGGSAADVLGGAGLDVLVLSGGTVANVSGGADADTITLSGTASVTGNVAGDGGADTITLSGSANVGGNIDGGTEGDTITLSGTANVTGFIYGGTGNDTIALNGGTAGHVAGQDGDDLITLDGANVGSIQGDQAGPNETGADTIILTSGTATDIFGQGGNDTITLNGATVGWIEGDSPESLVPGDDLITLSSGTASNVVGQGGNDSITLSGASITGMIGGDAGDDTFLLSGGTLGGALLGGDGSDVATITSSNFVTAAAVLNGGDDASSGDMWIDTLNIQANGALNGNNVTNWETINLDMAGDLALTGTLVTSSEPGFGLFLNSGALVIDGSVSVTGNVANSSVLDLQDGATGDLLTITGNYTGGGSLDVDSALDDTLATDRLVITGTVDGVTTINVNDVGGAPSFTGQGPGNGILLVDNTAGLDVAEGDFLLSGDEIVKVPFTYTLSTESDGGVYLQSEVLTQVYGVSVFSEVMREQMPNLRERLGDKSFNSFGDSAQVTADNNAGLWFRIDGTKRDIDGGGSEEFTSGTWSESRGELEIGLGIPMPVGGGAGVFGISIHATQSFADAGSGRSDETAHVDATGFGAGLSYAWFPGGGFYLDTQARLTAWDADLTLSDRGIDSKTDGLGWGVSLEAGDRIGLGADSALTPRLQVAYTDVNWDSFTDADGVEFRQGDSDSLTIEVGVTAEKRFPAENVVLYGDASVSHDLLGDSSVSASGFTFESGLEDTWGGLALGLSSETQGGTSFYVQAEIGSALSGGHFADSWGYGLKAGVRVDF